MPSIYSILGIFLLFNFCYSKVFEVKIEDDWKKETPYSYLNDMKNEKPFKCTLRENEKNEIKIEGEYIKAEKDFDICQFKIVGENISEEAKFSKVLEDLKMSLHLELPKNPIILEEFDKEENKIEIPQQVIFRNHTDIKENGKDIFINILLTELKEIKTVPIKEVKNADDFKYEINATEDEIKQVIERREIILRNLDECYFQRIYLEAKDISLLRKEIQNKKFKEEEKKKKEGELEILIMELKIRINDILNKDDPSRIGQLAAEAEKQGAANKNIKDEGTSKGVKLKRKVNIKQTKKRGRKPSKNKKKSSEEEFEEIDEEEDEEALEEEELVEEDDDEEEEGDESNDHDDIPVRRSTRPKSSLNI
uniref:Uncharacterized protein n=1 Tax=Meloidogyne hapla TaxID=6305 RepID=A0A1I8BBE9_MELHA